MARGEPLASPYVMTFGDYLADPGADADQTKPRHAVRIEVAFNNGNHSITGATAWRAADCLWTKIALGVGSDGTPNTSPVVFDLSGLNDASTSISGGQLAKPPYNFSTIDDFMALQITAY